MQHKKSPGTPLPILISACLLGFVLWIPLFVVPPMEHILREELLLTYTQTGFLLSVPVIMLVALAIPGGIVADRIGVRKAAGIGVILIAVGSTLRGTATDFNTLLAFTFIYGAGLGWAYPNLPKLVSLWFPREKAGIATGIYTAAFYVGGSLAVGITLPLIFPITNTFQGTFFIWSIPTIVAAALWWILVKEPPSQSAQPRQVSIEDKPTYQVWRNKSLWLVAILFSIHNFFFFNWSGWAPALMMERGAPPDLAALIASLFLWVGIPSVLLAPRLSNKVGLRKPFMWGPSIILAFTSLWAIYVNVPMGWALMTVASIAHNIRLVIVLALPIELVPKKAVGTASGLLLSIGYIGGIIGPLIGGHILDLTGSLNLSLLILVGVSIAAAGVAFKIPETGPKATIQK